MNCPPVNRENEKSAMAPKISVCIPTYNYAHYIAPAIESVLNQRLTDFELIILDDCSKDNTEEAVSRFLNDKRVLFEKNERNLGLVANWNKCISMARGEYIKFVFADDMLASQEVLGLMAGILDSDPSVTLVASARHLIDSESRVIGVASHFPPDFVADGTDVINRCLKEYMNLIGEPTAVMFRRADGLMGFDKRYHQLVDLKMWFDLLEKGRFAFIAKPLACFRIHPGQTTNENAAQLKNIDDRHLLLSEYLNKPYSRINFIRRFYLEFDTLYLIRKFGIKGIVSREQAKKRIRERCSWPRYYYNFIIYKLLRKLFKMGRKKEQKLYGKPGQNPFGL